jgi:hypothetical protein
MVFLGIDPGTGGGFAAVDERGHWLATCRMPSNEQDVLAWLQQWPDGVTRAVLEYVRSSPQMGVRSAFTFGAGYGGLRMALVACNVPFDEVTPGKWQNVMQCRTGGDKNVTKRRATELFPGAKVTHAVADALLLAEFARRLEVRV